MFTKGYKKKLITATATACALLIGTSSVYAYTVKSGDTLSGIAVQHNIPLLELVKINPQIDNIDMIYVGDEINTDVNNELNTDLKDVNNVINNVNVKVIADNETNDKANYTDYEKDLLARLVEAEASGEPYKGKVAVVNVVLNRVNSPNFPDTIKEVIYQRKQFSPVSNGSINNTPSQDSIQAVEDALSGESVVGDSLYFYNSRIASSRWLDSLETTKVIGSHTFKR